MRSLVKSWIVLGFLLSLPTHARRVPASELETVEIAPGEMEIVPPKEDWVTLTSTAFFSKPTTLIEHRTLAKLRGILSKRRTTLKHGHTFNEKKRLKEICERIRLTYAATKSTISIDAKVIAQPVSYCRVRVHEKDGTTIDQLMFVSQGVKKNRTYITHTVTFFYPSKEEDPAGKEVAKFVGSVSRRDDG